MPKELLIKEEIINKIKFLYDSGSNRIDIAKKLNITEWAVRKSLKGYCQDKSYRLKKHYELNSVPFTDLQIQCILGTLLGDASLSYRKKTDCFEYQLSHCKEQKDYILYIASILGVKVNKYIKGKNSYSCGKDYYKLSCHNKYELAKLASLIIIDCKKTINQQWLKLLKPEAIAYWFMDDGSSSYIKNNPGIMVRLSTLSFSKNEIFLLQEKLMEFNIETSVNKHRDGYGQEIYIKQKSVNKFMDLIEPFIVDCMKYKIKRRVK